MSEYPVRPEVAVGALVLKDKKVLLVKRSQPPSENLWALPGGKVHLGETLQQAAEREILEETGIRIIPGEPVYSFDTIQLDERGNVRFHYVIIDLLAEFKEGELKAGDDASDAGWLSLNDLEKIQVNESTKQLVLKYLNPKPNDE
ncbi:MAG: NUDIX hydrolase [Gammaproteobacteria bacterium SG8_11]|nr:MAG: NUDIX hydrolase [Gammaproteobacteria bacterium SG8_11]